MRLAIHPNLDSLIWTHLMARAPATFVTTIGMPPNDIDKVSICVTAIGMPPTVEPIHKQSPAGWPSG